MTPLEQYPAARKIVYLAFYVVGLGLGGAQVGYGAAHVTAPVWLTVALAVYTFLGVGVGYTAHRNTTAGATDAYRARHSMDDAHDIFEADDADR